MIREFIRSISSNYFHQVTPEFGQAQLITFDVSYFPNQKGPYNFDTRPGSIDATGHLTNPASRWGGIMRAIDQTDFETSNVQYIEFWMQSPFLKFNNNGTGGQLYMDLGSISEDVLKDGRKLFENGLNTPNIPAAIDSSVPYGEGCHSMPFRLRMHSAMIRRTGLTRIRDLTDWMMRGNKANSPITSADWPFYLEPVPAIYQNALADPSADDYLNYRAPYYDSTQTNIIGRYKNINNPAG